MQKNGDIMLNYGTMLMDDPSRQGDNVRSLGDLYIEANITDGEHAVLGSLAGQDSGFTYDDARDLLDAGEEEVAGYLGSLVQKGVLDTEKYTEDDIERLSTLNESHDGLIHVGDVDTDEYGDLLSKQGAIYSRGHGIHVDTDTEPGTHFYLTEHGKDILDGLE